MKCPSCSSNLRQVRAKSVVVDVCPRCGGIWFDCDELLEFIKVLRENRGTCSNQSQPSDNHEAQNVYALTENKRVCPICSKGLSKFNYSYDSNIFLDKCPVCRGIWADAGEVKQISLYLNRALSKQKVKRIVPSDSDKEVAKPVLTESQVREISELARSRSGDARVKAIRRDLLKSKQELQGLRDLTQLGQTLRTPATRLAYFVPCIIPLSDENPRQRLPIVTVSMIVLCVIVFLGQAFLVTDPQPFFEKFGFVPQHVLSLGWISSMFLHAGIIHLAGNMLFLWIFGDNVEDRFTRLGFLLFYFFSGIFASILHGIFNWQSSIPTIGASGAISGVMGAYFIFYPRIRVKLLFLFRIVYMPAYVFLGFWFLFQVAFGLLYSVLASSTIAWFAHIGGFVFGASIACLKKKVVQLTAP